MLSPAAMRHATPAPELGVAFTILRPQHRHLTRALAVHRNSRINSLAAPGAAQYEGGI